MLEAAKVFDGNGAWFPGSALSLQSVPSKPRSSEILMVHTPFGFSPKKAPIASSGTSVGDVTLFVFTVSVTSFEAAKVFDGNGAWLPGSALSLQIVPSKTWSFELPLSLVIVTIVPAGDVSVMSRSALNVWRILVVSFKSARNGPVPATASVLETVE